MSSVLVVDDEQLFRDLLQTILRHHGHDVTAAGNGTEAIQLFERVRPHITLLDLTMPGMDGLAVLRRLRAIDPEAAIVVLTGTATHEQEQHARELGVTDFLRKEISAEALVVTLQHLTQRPPTESGSGPLQKASLLVVEDERNSREMLAKLLTMKGYRVQSASDGPEALRQVQRNRPQVILLDLYMPGMNGVEVLRRLKSQNFQGGIIALTGSQDQDLLKQALELGAVDILGKPVDLERLELVIEVTLVLSPSLTPATASADGDRERAPAILVVEDDAALAGLVQETLQARGYDVLVAQDGDAAFRLLRERDGAIDAVLTDIMLPRINGLDLTTLIQGQWPRTKVIVCSGQLSREQLARAGAAAWLAKPFTTEQLLDALQELGLPGSARQGQAVKPPSYPPAPAEQSRGTAARAPSTTAVAKEKKGASILVVEDEPEAAKLLRDFLMRKGYQVRFAATGAEALVVLKRLTPDLIIMDLSMPNMNGAELLRQLQAAYPQGLPYRVIVLTGESAGGLAREARSFGVTNILAKPLDPVQLEAAIRRELQ